MIRRIEGLLLLARPGGGPGTAAHRQGSTPGSVDGDTPLHAADARNAHGDIVRVCVSDNFIKVVDIATQTVCYEMIAVVEIDALLEQADNHAATADPAAVGIVKRGAATDLLLAIPDPVARETTLAYIAHAYRNIAGRHITVCSLTEDIAHYIRVDHTQAKPTIPFPSGPQDHLRLGRNTSVQAKLKQHGDRCVEYTDRVVEVTAPGDPHGVTKVIIVSDAALYVTEKAGKVEYRLPLKQLASLAIVAPADDAGPAVIALDSHTRPRAYFRARSAQALVDVVGYLNPEVVLGAPAAPPSPASAAHATPIGPTHVDLAVAGGRVHANANGNASTHNAAAAATVVESRYQSPSPRRPQVPAPAGGAAVLPPAVTAVAAAAAALPTPEPVVEVEASPSPPRPATPPRRGVSIPGNNVMYPLPSPPTAAARASQGLAPLHPGTPGREAAAAVPGTPGTPSLVAHAATHSMRGVEPMLPAGTGGSAAATPARHMSPAPLPLGGGRAGGARASLPPPTPPREVDLAAMHLPQPPVSPAAAAYDPPMSPAVAPVEVGVGLGAGRVPGGCGGDAVADLPMPTMGPGGGARGTPTAASPALYTPHVPLVDPPRPAAGLKEPSQAQPLPAGGVGVGGGGFGALPDDVAEGSVVPPPPASDPASMSRDGSPSNASTAAPSGSVRRHVAVPQDVRSGGGAATYLSPPHDDAASLLFAHAPPPSLHTEMAQVQAHHHDATGISAAAPSAAPPPRPANSMLSPDTDSVLRALEGSGRNAAAAAGGGLRQPAFDSWCDDPVQRQAAAAAAALLHPAGGAHTAAGACYRDLTSPTPSPYQAQALIGDLPLPASPAEPVTCGRSQSPSVRRGEQGAVLPPMQQHHAHHAHAHPVSGYHSAPLPPGGAVEWTPEAPGVAYRREPHGDEGAAARGSVSVSPRRGEGPQAAQPQPHGDPEQMAALQNRLAETEARLAAYIEANEQMRAALVQHEADAEAAGASPMRSAATSPTNGGAGAGADDVEQLKSLLLMRDAEIDDLRERVQREETAQEKAALKKKGRLSVAGLAKRPTRFEEKLAAKGKLAEAAVQFAKIVERKLTRLTEHNYEARVHTLEALLRGIAPDVPEVAAELGDARAATLEAERLERIQHLSAEDLRKQLGTREYEVLELRRQVKSLVEEGRRLAQENEATRTKGHHVAQEVVHKAKEKAEELAYEASAVKLDLHDATALVEKLQAEVRVKEQDATRKQQEVEKRYILQESELRKAYEARLAKVEERTQAYERKLARGQSQLLQDLHAKELELQHYIQGGAPGQAGGDGAAPGTPGIPELRDELARSRAMSEHLESQLAIANMQLEALCLEQAKAAAAATGVMTVAPGASGAAMPTHLQAPELLQQVVDLRDQVAARDRIVKELRAEMRRITPAAAGADLSAPYAAVRRCREQELDLLALHETNRVLQSKLDEYESMYVLAMNKIQTLEEQLSATERQGSFALAKAKEDAEVGRRQALEATARLEARAKGMEAGLYLAHVAKERREAKPEAGADALQEELLRCKAQLARAQELSDKEASGVRQQMKSAKVQAKQLGEAKLELEAKQAAIANLEDEIKRLRARCVEMKKAMEHAGKEVSNHAQQASLAERRLQQLEASQDTQRVRDMETQIVRATNQFNELEAHIALERAAWDAEKIKMADDLKDYRALKEKYEAQAAVLVKAQQSEEHLQQELAAQERLHEKRYQENIRSSIAMAMDEMQRMEHARRAPAGGSMGRTHAPTPGAGGQAHASPSPWLTHSHRNTPDARGFGAANGGGGFGESPYGGTPYSAQPVGGGVLAHEGSLEREGDRALPNGDDSRPQTRAPSEEPAWVRDDNSGGGGMGAAPVGALQQPHMPLGAGRSTTPRRQVPPHSPHTDVTGAAAAGRGGAPHPAPPQPLGDDGGMLTLKALSGGSGGGEDAGGGSDDRDARVAQIHKNLQEGGLVNESRINRCVERLYSVYNTPAGAAAGRTQVPQPTNDTGAERPVEPRRQAAGPPSRAKQGAAGGKPGGGYAQRYAKAGGGASRDIAPPSSVHRDRKAAGGGRAARDGSVPRGSEPPSRATSVPASERDAPAGCLPPSFAAKPGGAGAAAGAGGKSSETAALYAQLGLGDLAPYAAT